MPTTFNTDKDKFEVKIDVQQFRPDEIAVRTSRGYLIVEARHEEKEDGLGYVEREFIRKYELPQGAIPENVFSQISSEGVLTVTAPRQVTSSGNDPGGTNTFIESLKRLSKSSMSSENEEPCQGNCFQK
ncbi:unnamed protein product [Arctia plantaginis]|uniref:SHSP domain-containing protein n=1 Tax=Arctia plantaginis TaxID=874455 RepID=A0A8S1A8F9_ARCPL|nr:unnamed protein product [Arctia plantaginis]